MLLAMCQVSLSLESRSVKMITILKYTKKAVQTCLVPFRWGPEYTPASREEDKTRLQNELPFGWMLTE